MKSKLKLLLAMLVAMTISFGAAARGDSYTTDVSVLPQAAQATLTNYFKGKKVNHIKIDKDMFGVDGYEVILTDGTEIDFTSKGAVDEVDCGRNGKVPDGLIMKSIRDYVKQNYKNQNIVKYDVKRNGYEVELRSGVDLVFNRQGVFERIDD